MVQAGMGKVKTVALLALGHAAECAKHWSVVPANLVLLGCQQTNRLESYRWVDGVTKKT